MNTIIISILAFLLSIFSGCGMLQTPDQSMTFPGEAVVTDNIIDAIKTSNTVALEEMHSPNSKKSMKDLSGNIAAIIDAVDGEIIEYDWNGTSDYDKAAFGTRISRRNWEIQFNTGTTSYIMYITWEVINNRNPGEVGMGSMSLHDAENNLLATTYMPK